MKRFFVFLFLFGFVFSSFAHLCDKCVYVGCPGQIYGDSNSVAHLYRCDYYAGGAGHTVWSDETHIYPASCITCGNLVCPTHGTHAGGGSCPGGCPNTKFCSKQTCNVCNTEVCTVHGYHSSQQITFACGASVSRCFSSEADMNSFLSSLNRTCNISPCTKCMQGWCRTHGSHNCSIENTCPNGADCVISKCVTCGGSWCSTHTSHICSGVSGGGSGGGSDSGGSGGGSDSGGSGGGSDSGGSGGGSDSGGSGGNGTDLSSVISAINSVKDSVDRNKSSVDGVKNSVDGVKSSVDGVKDSVDGVKDSVEGVRDSVDGVKDSIDEIKTPIKNIGADVQEIRFGVGDLKDAVDDNTDRLVRTLDVTGSPSPSPADFNFNKQQEKPSLNKDKINRSVIDQISLKLFPNRINSPFGSGDLFLTFIIPCRSICSFVPDYKVELSSQSFWSNSAIVAAASFCKTVTYFFFGWVTLLAFARALRQW